MEYANRVVSIANKAVNNDKVVNVFLLTVFGALAVRSVNQQKHIEALEAEKDSLVESNKSIKKKLWDWKQQLLSEASSSSSSFIPLDRIRVIYGEFPPPPPSPAGNIVQEDAKLPNSKIMI